MPRRTSQTVSSIAWRNFKRTMLMLEDEKLLARIDGGDPLLREALVELAAAAERFQDAHVIQYNAWPDQVKAAKERRRTGVRRPR